MYAIWKRRIDTADFRVLPVADLPASGFRSVYCFADTDAQAFETLGSYANFKGTVFSSILFADCDSTEASSAFEDRLKRDGIAFEKYTTGNRGHHFHIEREADPSHVLPALDKEWVSKVCPGADLSIYHHVAMYRLPGAIHHKTGLKKELLYKVEGKPLRLNGTPAQPKYEISPSTCEMRSVFTDPYLRSVTVPLSKGERHEQGVRIALGLRRAGQPQEAAYWYLFNVGLMSEAPLSEVDILRMVDWAYNKAVI